MEQPTVEITASFDLFSDFLKMLSIKGIKQLQEAIQLELKVRALNGERV